MEDVEDDLAEIRSTASVDDENLYNGDQVHESEFLQASSDNAEAFQYMYQQMQQYYHYCFPTPSTIGPYDVVELKVLSLHSLSHNRETCRIIGVTAGESLHNIYRVIMTAMEQPEV